MLSRHENRCGGCSGCGGSGCCRNREIVITDREKDFLLLLAQIPFLPLVRFVRRGADPEQAETLAPVYLDSEADSADAVHETGLVLRALESKGLITLDYDKPLQNSDYTMFSRSEIFSQFSAWTTNSRTPDSDDLPGLERGSLALTALGQMAVDSLDDAASDG